MITKIINKFEKKLTPLLLSFIPLALLIIYLILNNLLNENNVFVISLAFIVNFVTALIILFNVINSMGRWFSSHKLKYFIQFVLWTISSLIIEYSITIPQIKWAIILANAITFTYIFELIHQYFKQRGKND